jgi:hypothetical protein
MGQEFTMKKCFLSTYYPSCMVSLWVVVHTLGVESSEPKPTSAPSWLHPCIHCLLPVPIHTARQSCLLPTKLLNTQQWKAANITASFGTHCDIHNKTIQLFWTRTFRDLLLLVANLVSHQFSANLFRPETNVVSTAWKLKLLGGTPGLNLP